MGKGYWHDVDKMLQSYCFVNCPHWNADWLAYQELELKYSLLEEENKKLKKDLEELKASNKQ